MGHCYEFAVEIAPDCSHAMVVAADGSACECSACGARCTGRFEACTAVLAQPGYVPLTAPEWARDHLEPARGNGHEPTPEALDWTSDLGAIQAETRELQDLTRELQQTVMRTVHEGVQTLTQVNDDTVRRADLTRLYEDLRSEIDLAARRQADAIQSVARELDHQTSRHQEALQGIAREVDLLSPRHQEAILGLANEVDHAARRQQDAIQSLRHEVDLTTRRRQEVMDRLADSMSSLSHQTEVQRHELLAVGKKLDRLERRVRKSKKKR